MPNSKNTQTVKEIKEKVSKAKSIVFTDYKGLDANKANELRAKMLEEGVELTVAKNTLLNIALKEEKFDAEKVKEISNLPSKDQLISQVVWGLKSPLSGFVNVLGGSQRKLVYALSALAKKKQG